MDALILPFLAALLAGTGDRSQRLVMMMAERFDRRRVMIGVALAAAANSLIAAILGRALRALLSPGGAVNFAAVTLMLALALLFAGLGALRQKPPEAPARTVGGVIAASAFAAFILGFGDSTQFLTLTLAARADSIGLTALGATAGMVVVALPAALLGERLADTVPLRAIRVGAGIVLLLLGFVAAVSALGLG